MSTMITGRENILRYQFLARLYALRVQRDTGLKHSRGSVLNVCRAEYGIRARRIEAAIAEMEAIEASDVSIIALMAEVAGKRAPARADVSIQPGDLQGPRHHEQESS